MPSGSDADENNYVSVNVDVDVDVDVPHKRPRLNPPQDDPENDHADAIAAADAEEEYSHDHQYSMADLEHENEPELDIDQLFDAFGDDDDAIDTSAAAPTAAAISMSSFAPCLPPAPIPVPEYAAAAVAKAREREAQEDEKLVDGILHDVENAARPTELGSSSANALAVNSDEIDDPEVVLDEFQTTTDASALPRPSQLATIATRHEVVLPPSFDLTSYVPIKDHRPPEKWARTYPFTLDPFQEYAIYCVQRSESVLVAAHTSAGKTVVAEYAIAQALANKQRVIYTSPIKALSNQKYREMLETFGDVGLMTGDVTISPRASCLVMTTEILRSMLYRGSEILREISWVIYDEIHYMRDAERGVVWEETLILLPPTVHFVFLSATIPNAKQFAQWICRIHNQPCHVVYTDYRPTPLQHYVFPAQGDGVHLIVDEKGHFREENFKAAMAKLEIMDSKMQQLRPANSSGRKKRPGSAREPDSDIFKILKKITAKNFHPVIIFSFSKRECETLAIQMSRLDLNSDEDKEHVRQVFSSAIEQLGKDDRKLPQIVEILPLLERGIGVHHSGLLPILKEIIEILFQEGLVKVLFATETFSIGLNMPAKTVVFTKVKKFDGKEERHLTGGEYIQMSGRAGRRGLDDKGIVIMMIDQRIDEEKAKAMMRGESDALYSAFRLGYNMILNLIRVEGVTPEYLIRHSFRQFQNNAKLPKLQQLLSDMERAYAEHNVPDEELVRRYFEARYTLQKYTRDFAAVVSAPDYALPFLQAGRLLQIVCDGNDYGYAILLGHSVAVERGNTRTGEKPKHIYILDVALVVDSGSVANANSNANASAVESEASANANASASASQSASAAAMAKVRALRPPRDAKSRELVVVPVLLSCVVAFSSLKIKLPNATSMRRPEGLRALLRAFDEALRRGKATLGTCLDLDPIRDMRIRDTQFAELLERIARYKNVLDAHPFSAPEHRERLAMGLVQYERKIEQSEAIKRLRRNISESEALLQLDELKARKRILRRLGYLNEADVVELKGRVACEISAGDPLLLAEMLFHGIFNELTTEVCVALLGVFTFTEKPAAKKGGGAGNRGSGGSGNKVDENSAAMLPIELQRPFDELMARAARVAEVSAEAQLTGFDRDAYLKQFYSHSMPQVHAWASGAKFIDVCLMSELFEGNIVRNFRLLEELLKQMTAAARAIGNQDLEIKFSEGISKIKRDIIFANSLYL